MSKPIVNGRTDLAALDGRLAGSMMAGDQQQNTITAGDGLLEAAVDRRPGAIEGQSVKVEHTVRIHRTAAEPVVPSAVERLVGDRNLLGFRQRGTCPRGWPYRGSWSGFCSCRLKRGAFDRLPR